MRSILKLWKDRQRKAWATRHNMSYLRLTKEQYETHCLLMKCPMGAWPALLKLHVDKVGRESGLCGDVISCAVADWIRTGGPDEVLR